MPSLAFDVSERELHNYNDGGDATILEKNWLPMCEISVKNLSSTVFYFPIVAKIYLFISILKMFFKEFFTK